MAKKLFILLCIFFLGFIIRFLQINQIPPGLNRDEASIGYTAFSLLKTGKDEYGSYLPISFKSFGDWKLPTYIYITVPFVALLGLNELAVRFPSVLLAALTTINVFFLTTILISRDDDQNYREKKIIPYIAALLFSLSPWSIHLSRNASEASSSIFFITLGLILFLKSHNNLTTKILSSLILAIPMYTYHGNHIFIPLLYIGLFIFSGKKEKFPKFLLPLLTFIIAALFIYSQTLHVADRTKISGLFITNDAYTIHDSIDLNRLDHKTDIFAKLFHNKPLFLVASVLNNYIRGFSPEFLFITGGDNIQHNIPNFGNLYLWDVPFLITGVYVVLKNKFKYKNIILWWLIISPIAASITRDAPHTNRMASFIPLPQIIIAIGIVFFLYHFLRIYKYYIAIFSIAIIAALLFINVAIWGDRYFIHFPIKREASWGGGFKELISKVEGYKDQYREIIIDRPTYSPYIYFLFYEKIDPAIFQKEVVRYPTDSEGFQHIKSFSNLAFKKLDWADDLVIPNRLLITWADNTPPSATHSSVLIDKLTLNKIQNKSGQTYGLKAGDLVRSSLKETIYLKSGQPHFYLIDISKFHTNIIPR